MSTRSENRRKTVARFTTVQGELLSVCIGTYEREIELADYELVEQIIHQRAIRIFFDKKHAGDCDDAPQAEYWEGKDFQPADMRRIRAWLSQASAASPPPSAEEFLQAFEDLLANPGVYEQATADLSFAIVWEYAPVARSTKDSLPSQTPEKQMDLFGWRGGPG